MPLSVYAGLSSVLAKILMVTKLYRKIAVKGQSSVLAKILMVTKLVGVDLIRN